MSATLPSKSTKVSGPEGATLLHSTSGKIILGFAVLTFIWVIFSNYLLHSVFSTVTWKMQSLKGLTYIAVAGVVLYKYLRAREKEERAARRLTELRLQRLSETNLIAIWGWHIDGAVTDANDAFLNLLGYTREELDTGKINWRECTPEEYRLGDDKHLARPGSRRVYEKEFLRKDGPRVPVLIGSAALDESSGIAYALDLTELKREQQHSAELAEQLRQAQKLEAVGHLASGIAHDFNNLLNVIIGYATLIQARLSPDDPLSESTVQILDASGKASTLVRGLVAFGGRQVLTPEFMDLNLVIHDLEKLLPSLISETVQLQVQLAPSPLHVEADRLQLERVIMNLVINARDAMPAGGTLSIETSLADDEEFKVSIRDSGIGMDEQTRSKIFEPFFTTKAPGQGSGLGLATVWGIVSQSGGHISVESEPGRGTTFSVFLPRAKSAGPTLVTKRGERDRATGRGSGTILLAEDAVALRTLMRKVLEMKGYKVLEAADGRDAVQQARTFQGDISAFVTDMIMPHMGGLEAARQIRALHPGVKIIYMTGYADAAVFKPGSLSASEQLIEKPILPEELSLRLREMMEPEARRQTSR